MRKFELRNIHLVAGNKTGNFVKADFNYCVMFKDRLTKVRGEILEQTQAIIAEVNHFFEILNIQEPESKPGQEFMDKWRLFRNSLNKLPEFKFTTKELRRNVHDVIEKRDKYAHADLGFTNNKPEIKYKKGTRIVIEPIDEKILNTDILFLKKLNLIYVY